MLIVTQKKLQPHLFFDKQRRRLKLTLIAPASLADRHKR